MPLRHASRVPSHSVVTLCRPFHNSSSCRTALCRNRLGGMGDCSCRADARYGAKSFLPPRDSGSRARNCPPDLPQSSHQLLTRRAFTSAAFCPGLPPVR